MISELFFCCDIDAEHDSLAYMRHAEHIVIYDTKRMSELARGRPKSARNLPEDTSKAMAIFLSLHHHLGILQKGPRGVLGGPLGLSWTAPGDSWGALGLLLGSSWELLASLRAVWGFKNSGKIPKSAKTGSFI